MLPQTDFHIIAQLPAAASRWAEASLSYLAAWPHPSSEEEADWLAIAKDWQTLLAGLIAFVPASIAAIFVWRQINDQRKQFSRVQDAATVKARLRLSRNISQVSRHLDQCYDFLLDGNFSHDAHALPSALLDDILEAAITSTSDNLNFFQLYVERLQGYASACALYERFKGEVRLLNCFKLLGELDELTDRIYPYARFKDEELSLETVPPEAIKQRLQHQLKRGKDISGSNLDDLIKLGRFDS